MNRVVVMVVMYTSLRVMMKLIEGVRVVVEEVMVNLLHKRKVTCSGQR